MKRSKASSGPSFAAVENLGAIRRLARECRTAGADPKCPASASTLLAEAALDAYARTTRPRARDGGRVE